MPTTISVVFSISGRPRYSCTSRKAWGCHMRRLHTRLRIRVPLSAGYIDSTCTPIYFLPRLHAWTCSCRAATHTAASPTMRTCCEPMLFRSDSIAFCAELTPLRLFSSIRVLYEFFLILSFCFMLRGANFEQRRAISIRTRSLPHDYIKLSTLESIHKQVNCNFIDCEILHSP